MRPHQQRPTSSNWQVKRRYQPASETLSAESRSHAPTLHAPSPAFTLLELMIVVAIMGIVLTMGVPIVYKMRHESALRKAVKDVVEVCSQARATAILQSKATCVIFHPREGSFAVQGGGGAAQKPGAGMDLVNSAPKGSGLSGQLSDRVAIDMLDVDLTEYKDSEEVKVWFYPNGVCDELTLILHALDVERDPFRAISLEVTTGLASVETDVNKLRSLKK
jgi:prepilin-type N-terminal cleavage/methylation domain-containing protein